MAVIIVRTSVADLELLGRVEVFDPSRDPTRHGSVLRTDFDRLASCDIGVIRVLGENCGRVIKSRWPEHAMRDSYIPWRSAELTARLTPELRY